MITANNLSGGRVLTVNRLSDNRILIILCEKDMRDFSLDNDKMSFADLHSRRIIMRILQMACRKTGLETRGKSVNVEALPLDEDCYILVTVSGKRGRTYRLKGSNDCLCFFLGNATNFLDAIDALCRQNVCCNKNSAYEWQGSYYLVFDYPSIPRKLGRILSEYAQRCTGGLFAAKIKEGGRPVCTQNAIMQIGRYL